MLGVPSTVGVSPYPHWYPGMLLNGQNPTQAQLTTWYNWYFHALVDAHLWEAASIRAAGFTGPIQVVIPGTGERPTQYAAALTPCPTAPVKFQCVGFPGQGLTYNPNDGLKAINEGAVQYLFLDGIANNTLGLSGFMVDISSVDDTSGTPVANNCMATDASVDYLTDPQVLNWSSVRWLSFNAKRNGLPLIGENPGENSASDMATTFSLMEGCGLTGLMWAFDSELYSGQYATIANYQASIAQANQ